MEAKAKETPRDLEAYKNGRVGGETAYVAGSEKKKISKGSV